MNAALRKLLKKGKSSAIPRNIEPMLATLVDEIPGNEQNWIYEIKWDGYRAVAYLNEGVVDIRSRNNKSFNEKFYPVYDALKKMGRTCSRGWRDHSRK
jgi:bifunctional non-homologous end joining protein LigD